MSSTLRLVNPRSGKTPITVAEFLDRLSSREIDRIEAQVRAMRETYHAPPIVADHSEYRLELFRFFDHYTKTVFHGSIATSLGINDERDPRAIPEFVWASLRRLHQDLHGAERDAIIGRNGGFIRIINDITEALVKERLESYVDLVFFDYLPTDINVRLRLAQELMDEYIRSWFHNEPDLKPPFMFAANIEQVLKDLALQRHKFLQAWRW